VQAVSNSTPLIYLAKIGELYLLEKLFDTVLIPVKVYSEVVMSGKEKGYHDAYLVEEFVEKGFIVKKEVKMKKLKNMPIGRGEAETIELAAREGLKDVLIDEAKARRIARMYNLRPKGTLWILVSAFKDDLLSKGELMNNIEELIKSGYRIKEEILIGVYRELIRE
jgi:predicted nucleic acid-binding protein